MGETAMTRLDGIDISHYQWDAGPLSLPTVAAIPTWWFATKATQSTQGVDQTLTKTVAEADATAELTHKVSYHWLSGTTDPVAQADHFLATSPAHWGALLDAEEAGITEPGAFDWCERVEDTRHRPCAIYYGLYVAGGAIAKSKRLRMSKYGPRPMHLAAYIAEDQVRARMLQTGALPDYPFDAWQFSSNGPVAGITGRCDMNRIDTVAAYDLVCGITNSQPQPEDDMAENYYVVTGAAAKFIGTPAKVRWTGPGDGKIEAAIATQIAAGNLKQVDLTGGPNAFAATFLEGPLPTGDSWAWTGDEFANTNEIKARASQSPAVDPAVIVALNDAVGRLGQENAQIKAGLIKAGGG